MSGAAAGRAPVAAALTAEERHECASQLAQMLLLACRERSEQHAARLALREEKSHTRQSLIDSHSHLFQPKPTGEPEADASHGPLHPSWGQPGGSLDGAEKRRPRVGGARAKRVSTNAHTADPLVAAGASAAAPSAGVLNALRPATAATVAAAAPFATVAPLNAPAAATLPAATTLPASMRRAAKAPATAKAPAASKATAASIPAAGSAFTSASLRPPSIMRYDGARELRPAATHIAIAYHIFRQQRRSRGEYAPGWPAKPVALRENAPTEAIAADAAQIPHESEDATMPDCD